MRRKVQGPKIRTLLTHSLRNSGVYVDEPQVDRIMHDLRKNMAREMGKVMKAHSDDPGGKLSKSQKREVWKAVNEVFASPVPIDFIEHAQADIQHAIREEIRKQMSSIH